MLAPTPGMQSLGVVRIFGGLPAFLFRHGFRRATFPPGEGRSPKMK